MKYNFSGFTQKANEALNISIDFAERMGHTYIGSEHLLVGISSVNESSASRVLALHGITSDKVTELIKKYIGYGTKTNLNPDMMTPRAKHIIDMAVVGARESGRSYVGTEHILMGILNDGENYAVRFITSLNGDSIQMLNSYLSEGEQEADKYKKRDAKRQPQSPKSKPQSFIEKYGRDLTYLARIGKLSKVIGREREIQRVVQILCRKNKNNPCLIGDPGVGKTAVVEGIADLIVNMKAPEILADKRIIEIDLTSMVAGTKYRGDFEERVKTIIDEAISNENIIIFIDEIHTIVGAGSAEGSTDAANMLKPYLARGNVQIIGATTLSEYKKTIQKDAALDRRFQQVIVEESGREDALKILFGIKDSYERFHNIRISDDAIVSAVDLSIRYITDRYLPDKAIDLIDEAAAAKKIKNLTIPDELLNLYNDLNLINNDKQKAINTQNYELAASLRDKEVQLKNEIEINNTMIEDKEPIELNKSDISKLVSEMTSIPVNEIDESESKKILNLENELNKSVIGQTDAVKCLSASIKRARAGLKDPNRPIGCYLFLGPTGVGKTELCKSIARILFNSEKSLIRFDMSEFTEKHSVSKLIGAPPGYLGYDQGGQLTDKIRISPYSVVLFDEIEKAHSDIYNILLQIMDDGFLTDSQGRKANFQNCVIILTSNIGSNKIFGKNSEIGFVADKSLDEIKIRQGVEDELKNIFKPEFLNRVDEIVLFNKLSKEHIKDIAVKMLNEIKERVREIGTDISFSSDFISYIAEQGYDEKNGARPLRRLIEKKVLDEISSYFLNSEHQDRRSISVDYIDKKIEISAK